MVVGVRLLSAGPAFLVLAPTELAQLYAKQKHKLLYFFYLLIQASCPVRDAYVKMHDEERRGIHLFKNCGHQ